MDISDKYRGFIIDLDGVIYLDGKLLPFSKNFVSKLSKKDKRYVFLTNDSILPSNSYSKLLNKLGIPCSENQVITPIKSFEEKINNTKKTKVKVLVIASKKIKTYLKKNKKINVIDPKKNFKNADIVLVAGSREFNYIDLMYACLAIQNGSKLFATSIDNTYPTRLGNVPATGSIIAAIEKATGAKVENLGKPSKNIFRLALNSLNIKKSEILVIGDNLNTDIRGSYQLQLDSALVLTGKTKKKDLKKSDYLAKPTYVAKNLKVISG